MSAYASLKFDLKLLCLSSSGVPVLCGEVPDVFLFFIIYFYLVIDYQLLSEVGQCLTSLFLIARQTPLGKSQIVT